MPEITFSHGAILALAIAGGLYDIRTRRIPNYLTFGGALCAFGYFALTGGWEGLSTSALGWLTGFVLFFPFYLLRGMGAGDVKQLAALGAWFGPLATLVLGAYTALAGGLLALVVVLWNRAFKTTFRNLWLLICHWKVVGLRALPEVSLDDKRRIRVPYGVPIALGAITTIWFWQ
ncbi:MAG: prepilin peptidase [Vicinamibacterales bacterium]